MNPREEEDKHYKSAVYKLYPNSSQERIMVETVDYCGSLYNTVLMTRSRTSSRLERRDPSSI